MNIIKSLKLKPPTENTENGPGGSGSACAIIGEGDDSLSEVDSS